MAALPPRGAPRPRRSNTVPPPGLPRPRRSNAVKIGAVGALAASFLGCCGIGAAAMFSGSGHDQYCVDSRTDTRVTDDHCRPESGYYHWYYVNLGSRVSGVGGHMSGGSYTVPSRGGFGGHGDSGGG